MHCKFGSVQISLWIKNDLKFLRFKFSNSYSLEQQCIARIEINDRYYPHFLKLSHCLTIEGKTPDSRYKGHLFL